MASQIHLTQIERPLNSAPRLVLQHATAKEFVNVLPFGCNQQKLDLVMKLVERRSKSLMPQQRVDGFLRPAGRFLLRH